MTILLTGFEPFADHAVNPSGCIALELDGKRINGRAVTGRVLPVERARVWDVLASSLDACGAELVVAMGVSGRGRIDVEAIARNVDDYAIADNAGCRVTGEAIVPGGPTELRTPIDAAELAQRLWLAGFDAGVSDDAGAFLCNHVYYRLLHAGRRAVFVHLPRTPDGGDGLEHAAAIVEALAWLSA